MQKKNFFSLAACVFFIYLALACKSSNKLWCGSMNTNVKPDSELENFVVFNDGSKIVGENISYRTGTFVSDQIKINEEKYKIVDTRGFKTSGIFYGRVGKDYAKRIIAGKINIYYRDRTRISTSTDASGRTKTKTYLECLYYYQVGDTGILEEFYKYNTIRELIQNCPQAAAMMDKSDGEIKKILKKNSGYLNSVFETYNSCK